MRAWAEGDVSQDGRRASLDPSWRAERARAQEAVMPAGRVVVSCPAPLGTGGLGRHSEEIVGALERRTQPSVYLGESSDPQPDGRALALPRLTTLLAPALRRSPPWRHWRASVAFDADAARRLPAADHLIAFNGTAVSQFRAARRLAFESISLMSANSHMRNVIRQHARAHREYPLERPWATRLLRRNLREYRQADRIYVASRYSWESFVEEGFSEESLSLFPLTPHPRFTPGGERASSGTFDVVYVGSLTVNKGVPLLLDAFTRLGQPDLRLVLVGGWKTPGVRRFIQQACARDGRISVSPGDPLPRLRAAGVCVHAAYEDGFAYAPAEALACGVPVIVSEDTGMKDLIDPGVDGLILPTGSRPALTEAIEAAYRGRAFRDGRL
jgi:glycosyltransferase involved in cell wall biosynthesis